MDHCLYVDDLYILLKGKNNNESTEIMEKFLLDIDKWTKYSGAKISNKKNK